MNSRKRREKKQIITLCVCAAVILALIIIYSIVLNSGGEDSETDDLPDVGISGQFTIIDEDYTRVTALSYEYSGEKLALHVENSKWTLDGDSAFPVDQEKLIMMAQAISDYGGFRQMVYDSTKESAYGFDEPLYKISVTYLEDDDETTYTREYMIGDKNALTGYYYFYVTGDTSVYMVNDALFTYFDYLKKDIFKSDTMPTPELADVLDLTLTYGENEIVLTPPSDEETSGDSSGEESDAEPAAPLSLIMNELSSNVTLSYDTQVGYGIGENSSDFSEYGFDAPELALNLHYYEYEEVSTDTGISSAKIQKEKNFSLIFGKRAELEREVRVYGGDVTTQLVDMVYVAVTGSDIAYAVEAAALDAILDAAGFLGSGD